MKSELTLFTCVHSLLLLEIPMLKVKMQTKDLNIALYTTVL